MSHAETADRIAAKLRAAGLHVERKDYEAMTGQEDIGPRSYVIVTDGESRAEGQVNNKLPEGRISGYGGPDGEALLMRCRQIAWGRQ